jgi:aminoglycoside phosphotransferase (APT) family kinase protein
MGPSDTDATAALVEWAEWTHGGPVRLAAPAETRAEGFDSAIHFVQLTGPQLPDDWRVPLVLRVKPDPERGAEAQREASVHEWLVARSYPAPRVLAVFAAGELGAQPAQVMTRAPGVVMLDQLKRAPWSARSLMRRLAALHVRLHRLPPDDFPVGDDLLDRRLALSRDAIDELDDDALSRALAHVEQLAPQLRGAPDAVCHGDFHPLNVVVDRVGDTVIDWTDAGVGDRHGDVARTLLLFDLASIAVSQPLEKRVLAAAGPWLGRAYGHAYAQQLPLDAARIALWKPVHLLHGWTQAASLHSGRFDAGRAGDDDRRDRVPAAMIGELRRRFEQAMDTVP